MQISWWTMGLPILRNMGINQFNMNRCMFRLSTGKRINSAADDPAGLAISQRMESQIRGLEMAKRNSEDGISLLQTEDGYLDSVHSILQRMNELATQCANGTLKPEDRKYADIEFQQLKAEINRIGRDAEFNEMPLFDSTRNSNIDKSDNTIKIHVGANSNQNISVKMHDMNAAQIGIGDSKIDTQENAQKAMDAVKNAINDVSRKRAVIGATMNRLEFIVQNQGNAIENLTSYQSRILDADIAKEAMEYAKNNILMQVDQSLVAQVNKQGQNMVDMLKKMLGQ